jgi:nucleotide-binding universal stress UspA family protein
MFEKILVPLDTSPLAEQVIPHVIELARAFNSAIDIINVCELHDGQGTSECQTYLEAEAARIKSSLAPQAGIIQTETILGSPGHNILKYAEKEKADLIMMSSHGRSGVTLWPFGSTVDKILRQTGVPLIIVKVLETRSEQPPIDLFKRILVPLDGSELGAKVVPFVVEIAGKLGSEVVLLQVIETTKHVHTLGRIDTVPFIEGELGSLEKRATDYLEQESLKFAKSGPGVLTVIKEGNVAEEILKYASEKQCSLVAISSHGHSGFESWIIGSVTSKVLSAGTKSLLFVPALES